MIQNHAARFTDYIAALVDETFSRAVRLDIAQNHQYLPPIRRACLQLNSTDLLKQLSQLPVA